MEKLPKGTGANPHPLYLVPTYLPTYNKSHNLYLPTLPTHKSILPNTPTPLSKKSQDAHWLHHLASLPAVPAKPNQH